MRHKRALSPSPTKPLRRHGVRYQQQGQQVQSSRNDDPQIHHAGATRMVSGVIIRTRPAEWPGFPVESRVDNEEAQQEGGAQPRKGLLERSVRG